MAEVTKRMTADYLTFTEVPLLAAVCDESVVSDVTFFTNAAAETIANEGEGGIAFRIRDCVAVVGNHFLDGLDLLC